MAAKSAMSRRNTVVFTTSEKPRPAASSTAARLANTLSVCSVIPPLTTSMVAGSRAIWPAVKRKPPALTACEYGPIALGASEVAIVFTATPVVLGNCWRNPKYGSSKLTGPPPHRSPGAEHPLRIPGRDPGHFLDIKAAQFREACADHGDTARFVA